MSGPIPETKIASLLLEFLLEKPRRAILVLVSLLLSGLADGVGMSIFPLIGLIIGESAGPATRVEETVFRALETINVAPSTTTILILIVLAMAAKGVLFFLAMLQIGYAITEVSTEYRVSLIRALMRARWSFFLGHPIGSFGNALGMEAHTAASVYLGAANLVSNGIQIAIYVSIATFAYWQASAAAILAGAVIVLLLKGFVTMGRRAGRNRVSAFEGLQRTLTDALQGMKPMKAMALEDRFASMLEHETQNLNAALRLEVLSKTAMQTAQEPLIVIFVALGIILAIQTVDLSPGLLIVMGLLFVRTTGRISDLQRYYRGLRGNQAFRDSIKHKIAKASAAAEPTGGDRLATLSRAIVFENVSFSYGKVQIFDDLSLTIPANSVTTVFGPSGLGKTTLLDLITGLYETDSGQILLDGVALSSIDKASWRRTIGYLPQETFLLHESIRANVTLGDKDFAENEIEDALRKAGALEFASRAPQGLDTIVGERGGKLSGGQRQRIALARAIIRKPRLLILDEPTAALDRHSEAEICETLRRLGREMTVLAISHQEALTRIADQVIDLESVIRGGPHVDDRLLSDHIEAGSREAV